MHINPEFGAIIPLAWPDSLVNSSCKFVDPFFSLINISKKGFYKLGHAALLIAQNNGEVMYFDFGRYISPFGKGRIRGANTDPELRVHTKAEWKNNKLLNIKLILLEIAQNYNTHGEGEMYAGIQYMHNINLTLKYILQQQATDFHNYGAYTPYGTNCSRFVAQTIAKNNSLNTKRKFLFPFYTTPSPLGNIYNSNGKTLWEISPPNIHQTPIPNLVKKIKTLSNKVFFKANDELFQSINLNYRDDFSPPQKHPSIPNLAHWIGGMGAGAWYNVEVLNATHIHTKRQQKNGAVDYEANFKLTKGSFNPLMEFKPDYGSNYQKTILLQGHTQIEFTRI